jgi:hypothetical protein
VTSLHLCDLALPKSFGPVLAPTLATGGKAIITSTPNSDEDQFALLWKGALKCEDEFGNPTDVGINGLRAIVVIGTNIQTVMKSGPANSGHNWAMIVFVVKWVVNSLSMMKHL